MKAYKITATWDAEAEVWVAESQDVPGLATGAPTLEALMKKLRVMVPELLDLNGVADGSDGDSDFPIKLMASWSERITRPA